MTYRVELKPRAIRDLKNIEFSDRERILSSVEKFADDLSGNVSGLPTSLLSFAFVWVVIGAV